MIRGYPLPDSIISKLMGLTYQIQYKKGADNRVADALSRLPQTVPYEIAAISVIKPVCLQDLQAAYAQEPSTIQLVSQLSISSPQGHYLLKDGIIRYKNRIWVGPIPSL